MHNVSAIAEEVNIHLDLRGRYCRFFQEHTELTILATLTWEALPRENVKNSNKMLPPVSIELGTSAIPDY